MKIRRPGESPPSNQGFRPVAYDKAKEAAIEKQHSHYIRLSCGHLTTWELDELYSAWRPSRNKFFCETCNKWKLPRKLHKRRNDIPSDPLF